MLDKAIETNELTFNQKKQIVLELQKKEEYEPLTFIESFRKITLLIEMKNEWVMHQYKQREIC